jgi:hypothetical protein
MKTNTNPPGTYKLIVERHDGRNGYTVRTTDTLTITRPNNDNTLIRKFIKADLFRTGDAIVNIKRVA